ncbi:MAG: CHAD domain-containing protein [Acidobacteria bacterium]|nr:CHAD domain-containing protein [Acidobacteriota bacterium]
MARPFKIRKVLPSDRASRAAVRILRTRLREFYSHWPDAEETPTPEQLHNQRISGKRLRYSAETVRDLYPDRLALLIDLLKRQQDTLGLIQDCVTQRAMVAVDLARRRNLRARRDEIAALEALLAKYDERQAALFTDLRDIWRGMTRRRFRATLKDLVSHPVEGR